jgi:hypothetical protein
MTIGTKFIEEFYFNSLPFPKLKDFKNLCIKSESPIFIKKLS